jgi:hypothetical protein
MPPAAGNEKSPCQFLSHCLDCHWYEIVRILLALESVNFRGYPCKKCNSVAGELRSIQRRYWVSACGPLTCEDYLSGSANFQRPQAIFNVSGYKVTRSHNIGL